MAPSRFAPVNGGGPAIDEPAPTVKWEPSGAVRSKQPPSSSSKLTHQGSGRKQPAGERQAVIQGGGPALPSSLLPHELLSSMAKKASASSGATIRGSEERAEAPMMDSGPLLTPRQHAKLQGLSECLTALQSLSKESERLISHLDTTLTPLISSSQPILSQSTLLLRASKNIQGTRESLLELISCLETSHKVEASLRSGPRGYRGDLDGYLGHLSSLDQAIKFLEAHSQLASAQEAYSHSLQVQSRAMKDCDQDFSQTLIQQTSMTLPSPALLLSQSGDEYFSSSIYDPPLDPILGPPLIRLQKLAQVTLRSGHEGCVDAYIDIRRKQAVEGSLRLIGFDPTLSLSSLELQGIDQIDKTVVSWSNHLRVACLIASSELRLSRSLWGPLTSISSEINHEGIFYSVISPTFQTLLKQGQDLSVVRGGRGFGALIGALSKGQAMAAAKAVQSLPTQVVGDVLDLAGVGGGGGGGGGGRDQRIFTLLEMSRHLAFILPSLKDLLSPIGKGKKLVNATSNLLKDLSAQAKESFHHFEQGLIRDQSKAQMVDGTVHPICAHVLSYLRRLFSYPNAREVVFDDLNHEADDEDKDEDKEESEEDIDFLTMDEEEDDEGGLVKKRPKGVKDPSEPQSPRSSSIGLLVSHIMDSLIQTLEVKSRQYKSPALASLFMMNNMQYVCSTVAGSTTPSHLFLTDRWLERHRDKVEAFGQSYHETTWLPIIQPLLQVISGEDEPPHERVRWREWVKSKFKDFNTALEAVYVVQSGWTIADSRLKASVRKVIKQDLLRPYTSFFNELVTPPPGPLDWTSNRSKYVKYDPKRVQQMIDQELFTGQPMVLSKASRAL